MEKLFLFAILSLTLFSAAKADPSRPSHEGGTPSGTVFSPTGDALIDLADPKTDNVNLRDYTAMTGSKTDAVIVDILRAASPPDQIIHVPTGAIWPNDRSGDPFVPSSITDAASGNVIWMFENRVPAGNRRSLPMSSVDVDNDMTVAPFNGSMRYSRHNKTAKTTRPLIYLDMKNSSPNLGYDNFNDIGKMYYKTPAMTIVGTQDKGAVGSLTGLSVLLNDYGNNSNSGYSDQTQGVDITVNRRGQDATWGLSVAMNDRTVAAPNLVSQIGAEIDLNGNGPEAGDPQVDASSGGRKNLWIGIGAHPLPKRAAATAYKTGAYVSMSDTAGLKRIYEAANDGVSGSDAITWPTSGSVVDGTVRWNEVEEYSYEVTKAIWIVGNDHGNAFYDHILASNARVRDDLIDASLIKRMGADFAVLRMAPNMPIDFDYEHDGSVVKKRNLHTLFWKDNTVVDKFVAGPGLNYGQAYAPSGISSLVLRDDGGIAGSGPTYLALGADGKLSSGSSLPPTGVTIGNGYYSSHGKEGDLIAADGGLNLVARDRALKMPEKPQIAVTTNSVNLSVPLLVDAKIYSAKGMAPPIVSTQELSTLADSSLGTLVWDKTVSSLKVATANGWMVVPSYDSSVEIALNHPTATGKMIVPFGTPSSSTATCKTGQMEVDTTYLYTCVATNTWHRLSNGTTW